MSLSGARSLVVLIVKFEGAYHGMSDEGQMSPAPLLIDFLNLSLIQPVFSGSSGPDPNHSMEEPEHLKAVFDQQGAHIAAIIAEP